MASASDCTVMELRDLHPKPSPKALLTKISSRRSRSRGDQPELERQTAVNEELPGPTTAPVVVQQRWNESKVMIYRTIAAFWGFTIMGANDAAIGALIPYLQDYYQLTYSVVALLFLSPVIGYTLSAILNNMAHMKFGQRGIAIICPSCHLIAYLVAALHPPFPVIVVFFALSGFGNGLEDAAWNAWIGNMANANEVLGFLHGFYGLGATIAPLVATTMITKSNLLWFTFYYVMAGLAGVELVISMTGFWTATAAEYRASHPRTTDHNGNRMTEALWNMPAARVTWLCALFLFGYVGVEVALGGWITTFMLEVRHSSHFASGMSATGFWLGMTVGRVVLGFVTPRLGETLAIMIYIPITMALELIFWLVPQFYVSTVAVALQGFFLGPLFPASVVAVSKLLPKHLHVSSIGFAAAFGGGGAAIFPFAVGAIAQAKGVKVLQPIVLAILGLTFLLWCGLPRMSNKKSE
ncbi:uncharacterized protein PV09_02977 [Verruconis gallopava]|uniref:Major facilitator superfamily (MFS) profile domain-containing protein n=1 Tax=Verruconis gallopava TaxID=253628 RepID=A0A0D1Z0Q8_9PEZI|nr:uncharacterized protein PV09_02977 [Verruconis gallopava]KIW06547.1 hypothetical protein PV09_02977 [Verruconis gallopava]